MVKVAKRGRPAFVENKRKLVGVFEQVAKTNDTGLSRSISLKLVEDGYLERYAMLAKDTQRPCFGYRLTDKGKAVTLKAHEPEMLMLPAPAEVA